MVNIVQIFIGEQYYPKGGADDLKKTLFNQDIPSDQEICELFRQFVLADTGSGDDTYWLNACVTGDDESVRIERWLAYTTKEGRSLPDQKAPYVTAQIQSEDICYSLVAIEQHSIEGDRYDFFGPKGHPEVMFF